MEDWMPTIKDCKTYNLPLHFTSIKIIDFIFIHMKLLTWNIDSTSKKKEKIFSKIYLLTAIHNSNITQTKGNNVPQKKVTSIGAPVHDIQLHEN